MTNPLVTRVPQERWQEAQKFELDFAETNANLGDDFNVWWSRAFDEYRAIQGKNFPNVLEVGCGPNTNVRLILPLVKFQKLWLEDPLIESYMRLRTTKRIGRVFRLHSPLIVSKLRQRYQATVLSEPLEQLSLSDGSVDLCVCINVLDHVRDVEACMYEMTRVLSKNGVLILGQDLSNDDDRVSCPESWTDIGHPIKVDEQFLDGQLSGFTPLFRSILPRQQGRNPRCHYATYLLIGEKVWLEGQNPIA